MVTLVGDEGRKGFPSIFTLAIEGLGGLTSEGSGVLVCSIVGGAALPILQSALANHFGIQRAFILPALCYLYIIYFALRGAAEDVPALRAPLDGAS